MKFNMHNHTHTDVLRIYDLTVVHSLKCLQTWGPALFICYGPRTTSVRQCLHHETVGKQVM